MAKTYTVPLDVTATLTIRLAADETLTEAKIADAIFTAQRALDRDGGAFYGVYLDDIRRDKQASIDCFDTETHEITYDVLGVA